MGTTELARNNTRTPDLVPPDAVIVTADDVFNFDKGLLLASPDRKFGVDFFNGNHVTQAAEKALAASDISTILRLEAAEFIKCIAEFPQIQIPTVDRSRSFKSRLDLNGIMSMHNATVSQTIEEQMEWAYFSGDDTRLKAISLLEQSITLSAFKHATSASLTLKANEYNPVSLIPLFNISTAARLSSLFDLPLPELLTDLETTSLAAKRGYILPEEE